MKVALSWLQELIELPTTDVEELRYVFTMLGHEVEGVEELQAGWSDVVVGRVTDISAHPDADKIRVCQVDTGEGPEQIICGAWNFERGAYVAVARPGAVLPGGFEIGRREIRGVDSNGMICSERELRLGDDHTGIIVLEGEPELGMPFSGLVELPDVVFDVDITTNRPDAMSVLGVARDLAAYFGVGYRMPDTSVKTVGGSTRISVEIADPEGCRRFTAREITSVEVGPSPLWLRHRLHKVGVRAISNVVDVTNYVMLELGHPLHAFDADLIAGDRLLIRRAKEGETLVTLDDEERRLSGDDLIIYDADGPTSMSGTMGGARSEVSEKTKRVLMEAASWDPPTIMYMSRRHGLRSEASIRFERGVDPNLAELANRRASALVAELAGGEVLEGAVDEVAVAVEPWKVDLLLDDVERLLGPGFTSEEVSGILERLGMRVEGTDPMKVTVPTYRPDLTRPADLVEEVARIHGYDRFEATLPTGASGGLTREQLRERRLRVALAGIGLHQAISLPFVAVEDLRKLGWDVGDGDLLTVKNPLREEESKLRPSLLPGLLEAIRFNLSHGQSSVGLFETGKVFLATPDPSDPRLPYQIDRVAWSVFGEVGLRLFDGSQAMADGAVSLGIWRHLVSVLDLREVEIRPATVPGFHPARTAEVRANGVTVGHVGELAPRCARAFEIPGRVAVAELDLHPLLLPPPHRQGRTPSVYPHVDFDLSFVIEAGTPVADLVQVTEQAAGDLIESTRVFDEFRGPGLAEGKRAVAIRYRLRAADHTLSNEEVAPVRDAMIQAAEGLGAELRGR